MKGLSIVSLKLREKAKEANRKAFGVESLKFKTMSKALSGIADAFDEVDKEMKDSDLEKKLTEKDVADMKVVMELDAKAVLGKDLDIKLKDKRKYGGLKKVPAPEKKK